MCQGLTLFVKDDNEENIIQREVMSIHDLEAYLFERYQHMEDQWEQKNVHNSLPHQNDEQYASQMEKRMRQCAKVDAESIFQLLLQHAPAIEEGPSQQQSIVSAKHNNTKENGSTVNNDTTTLTKRQFRQSLRALSTQIHYPTILPLAASMLLVGSSVGVISPIMPFVAEKLHLTSTHYGIVISSFALSKMMGNVPSAILVEWHGRKPYLVHSLWLVGLGVAGMGFSSSWMQLCICRMTVGLGVAAFTTASSKYFTLIFRLLVC